MAEESGNSSRQQKVRTNSSYEGSNPQEYVRDTKGVMGWYSLGVQLGIKTSYLKEIEKNYATAFLRQILRDTKEVTDWYCLGIYLGIPTSHLKHIEKNHSSNAERCRIEVIDYWLNNDPEPTRSKLAQAVEDMGGHANVVQTLRGGYEDVRPTLKDSGHIACKVLAGEKNGSGGFPRQSISSISDESSGYQSASQPECSHEQSNILDEPSESSDEPTTPVNCTCGNCRLYTLCTRGCYPGVGSDVPLPSIWNGTGKGFEADDWQLTEYERELTNATRLIVQDFADLVLNTRKSLAQKVELLDDVILWLRQLEIIKALPDTSMTLSQTIAINPKNMQEVFMILSDYWSWYNYYLLELLIKKFGAKGDEAKLQKYLDNFTLFLQKRLPQSQDSVEFGTQYRRGQKKWLFKVDEHWDTVPLGQIKELHHKIAEILKVPLHVLYLASVSKGCICLEFLVPESMGIPLCASQKEVLVGVGVFRMECGEEYVFEDPGYMGHVDRPEEEDKGYEGCSESDGGSDVDRPSYPQTGKHIRKKGKIHGRKSEGSSKLPASTDLMPSERLPESPDVFADTVQLHSSKDIEGHEHVQELQTVVAKEEEQLEKGGSTRDVQDIALLDHDHNHSAFSTAYGHSAVTEASYEKLLKMLVYGAPGAGKSTLAKRLVAELAQRTTVSRGISVSYEKLLKMLVYGAPRAGKSALPIRLVAELAQRTTGSQKISLKILMYGAPRAGKSTLTKWLVAGLAQRTTVSQGLPDELDVSVGTDQLHSLEGWAQKEDEGREDATELPLQNMIANEDEQLKKKTRSDHTRAVQKVAVLNRGHPSSPGSTVDPDKNSAGTPLHLAAKGGRFDTVKYLVEKGANIHSEDSDRSTPLHLAAEGGHLDTVKYLVEKGANIHSEKFCGHQNTPLHLAAKGGHLDTVKYLVEKGANIHSEKFFGSTPLRLAAEGGHLDTVKYLVEKGANINSGTFFGSTPLHLAAEGGHLDTVKYLVEKGANINSGTFFGSTPLHLAAEGGHLDTVKYLVEKGANIHSEKFFGHQNTPLHLAAEGGHLDTVKYLVEKGANIHSEKFCGHQNTPLHLAAEGGHLDTVKYLVEKGANIHSEKFFGSTPLHLAAEGGHLDTVKYLVEKGANIHCKDGDGDTPLYLAAKGSHFDTVKYLVEKGANIHSEDSDGDTPLHLAARGGHLDTVKCLVEKGANIDSETSLGDTPLYLAAKGGHFDTVKYLVEKGANIHSEAFLRCTPLHLAAGGGHFDTVKYLVEKGANIHSENVFGSTPLHLAAEGGHLDTVKYLVEKRVNIHSRIYGGPLLLTMKNYGFCPCVTDHGTDFNITDSRSHSFLYALQGQKITTTMWSYTFLAGQDPLQRSNHAAILRQILRDTKEVTNWYCLGTQLASASLHLQHIVQNHGSDCEQYRSEVKKFWLRNQKKHTLTRLTLAVDVGGHAKVVLTLGANHEVSSDVEQSSESYILEAVPVMLYALLIHHHSFQHIGGGKFRQLHKLQRTESVPVSMTTIRKTSPESQMANFMKEAAIKREEVTMQEKAIMHSFFQDGDEDARKMSDQDLQTKDRCHCVFRVNACSESFEKDKSVCMVFRVNACSESFEKDKSVCMVHNEKEIGSQKYSGRGVGHPLIEIVAQTQTQSTKESTSEVENSFNTNPLMSGMLGLVSPANPALPYQMMPPSFPSKSSSLSMGSKSESSGGQVNCVTSHSPLSFKSTLVTGLGRCIGGRGGDNDPWYNCCPFDYKLFSINACDTTPEELLMTSVPISPQDDILDMGAPLSLQPSMCVCDPLVEMVAKAPIQCTKESFSEIEIPGENLSYNSPHLTVQEFVDAFYLSDGKPTDEWLAKNEAQAHKDHRYLWGLHLSEGGRIFVKEILKHQSSSGIYKALVVLKKELPPLVKEYENVIPEWIWKEIDQLLELSENDLRQLQEEYGSLQAEYGSLQAEYGSLQSSPQEEYGSPQEEYGSPQEEYGSPQEEYGSPQEEYGSPQEEYDSPQEEYDSPQEEYGSLDSDQLYRMLHGKNP